MTSSQQSLTWAECYGGPADGERVPIPVNDPVPHYPHLYEEELTWYQLYRHPEGRFRYALLDMPMPLPWKPVTPYGP